MQQSWFLIPLWICFLLHPGESYRTQKASRRTLDHIKQLITLRAQRHIGSTDAGALADQTVLQRRDPEAKQHHDELVINDPDAYFQGDVDLSEKQAEILSKRFEEDSVLKGKGDKTIRKKRKVGREPLYVRWDRTHPISYDFAESIPLETRRKIRTAIGMWEERTCVRFQENGPNVDRIEFFDGGGCSSFVGRTGGTQGISISTPGCDIVGIIAHEIGHALGIFHEQARPDQNNHIFINYNNIPLSRWNNFHPLSENEADTFNLPYDTGSVMHYGAYGFAADPYITTITTRDKFQQQTIGQREGPSFLDYAAVKSYLTIVSSNNTGLVSSKWPTNCTEFPAYLRKFERIGNAPVADRMLIAPPMFANQQQELNTEDSRISHFYLKLPLADEKKDLGDKPQLVNIAYHCTEHCAYMRCEHDGYPNPKSCDQCLCPDGFAGRTCEYVHYTDCGALIKVTRMPVIISSPNYPDFFKVGDQCIWLLKGPHGGSVYLQFIEQFQLQCEDTCDKSYVEVKTAADFRITGYRFCCSRTPNHIFRSVTSEMVVIFRGFGDPGKGFKAKIWSDEDDETSGAVIPSATVGSTEKFSKVTVPTVLSTKSSTVATTKIDSTAKATATTKSTTSTIAVSGTIPPPVTRVISPVTDSFTEENDKYSTLAPTISVEIRTLCKCGEWSEWAGPCSQECGGCGKRFRTRQCSSNTQCRTEDKRACGFKVCPHGTNFLINSGEFHILWKGCCVGLFRSGDVCSALDDSENPFLKFLETLLSAQDARRNRTLLSDDNAANL